MGFVPSAGPRPSGSHPPGSFLAQLRPAVSQQTLPSRHSGGWIRGRGAPRTPISLTWLASLSCLLCLKVGSVLGAASPFICGSKPAPGCIVPAAIWTCLHGGPLASITDAIVPSQSPSGSHQCLFAAKTDSPPSPFQSSHFIFKPITKSNVSVPAWLLVAAP